MAEIKRYDICAVIDENRNGEYVLYSDHLAALKAAVKAEQKVWAHAVAQGLPPDIAKAIDEIIARGAAHD